MDDATLKMWEESLSPGMTAGDSIRAKGWNAQADSLPVPRSRSIDEAGSKTTGTVDFEIRKKLGAGGMGVVYTAHQTSINREVALKMVRPEHADSKSASEALMSEAVVTGALDHPNVVPVYDLGVDDHGHLFYAMKEVEGFPWSVLIDEKSLVENLDILLRVADTIAFAHSKGILHRDLKPQNIMLGAFGEIMVMDWGAACTLSGSNVAGMLPTDTAYCGTPAYMAPEMAKADKNRLGEASDIYLLGAILYHILTGRPPRCETDPLICLAAAARNQIDPVDDDGELLRIALKAMATAPADRYEEVEEFQQAIRNYRSHTESLLLQKNAKTSLVQAKTDQDYDVFNQAIFGFKEALVLWPKNPDAGQMLESAKLDFAHCARGRYDYELALSQLEAGNPAHADLIEEIHAAMQERDARKNRVKRLLFTARILLASITILSIAGFFLIRAEQKETEVQRLEAVAQKQNAGEAHRRSLIHLISAHYGNRNYEAAVATFWTLYDGYGKDALPDQTLSEVRISSAMNPYRGWISETNGIPQTVHIGGVGIKRPGGVMGEVLSITPTPDFTVPEQLKKLSPVVCAVSDVGRQYSLLTQDGVLISGSLEPGGFYLEQRIRSRDIVGCALLENGLTVLKERSGTLHCYNMNTYAIQELSTSRRVIGVCAGPNTNTFYGLMPVNGGLGVYDIPVWKRWDSPYRLLAGDVDKGGATRWEDFTEAVDEGRDSPNQLTRIHGSLELVMKSDGKPILDSRLFPGNMTGYALSTDGSLLALVADEALFVMNLSGQQPIHSLRTSPVHYVSKQGSDEWPYASWQTAARTIEHALESVSDGDTVVLDDGVFETKGEVHVRSIKNLTLRSRNGHEASSILCNGAGRTLRFLTCTGTTAVHGISFVVDSPEEFSGGLEFQNCENVTVENCWFEGNRGAAGGGGLYVSSREWKSSHIQIENNTFHNNSTMKAGGGLHVLSKSVHGTIRVENCISTENKSHHQGGGIFLQTMGKTGGVQVRNCNVLDNKTQSAGGFGGGLNLAYGSLEGDVAVSNCLFAGNQTAGAPGGGVSVHHRGKNSRLEVVDCIMTNNIAKMHGGGLAAAGAHVSILVQDCILSDNQARHGGGCSVDTEDGYTQINRCRVERNRCYSYGGGISGHLVLPQFPKNQLISNCLIADNYSAYQAGGVRDRTLVNCTIVNNEAPFAGGASYSTLINCIVYGNIATNQVELTYLPDPDVNHMDLYQSHVFNSCVGTLGEPAGGCITNNPAFVDPLAGDYRLQPGSPCIDIGSDQTNLVFDLDGFPRTINGRPDLGCYEFQGQATTQ